MQDLFRGGKSGLLRTQWWVTPTVRKDRDSATESIPPRRFACGVRVKRCGKSAPAVRVTGWLGKPHWEQDQAERKADLRGGLRGCSFRLTLG